MNLDRGEARWRIHGAEVPPTLLPMASSYLRGVFTTIDKLAQLSCYHGGRFLCVMETGILLLEQQDDSVLVHLRLLVKYSPEAEDSTGVL